MVPTKAAFAALFLFVSFDWACAAGAQTKPADPPPQLPTLQALAGAPAAGPAPRLEMNDFRDRAYDPNARGTVSLHVRFQTKSMGLVFFPEQTVFVIPDNAYARWIAASYEDRFLGRIPSFVEDPAVEKCCIRSVKTDEQGNVRVENLRPGAYIAFGGYSAQTGSSLDRFVTYPALDQNGNPTTASIPTLVFTNVTYEAIIMLVPFTITPAMPDATPDPVAVFDGVYR